MRRKKVKADMAEQEIKKAADVGASREATDGRSSRAGKYLTFHLETEEYGIEILQVTTIIGLLEITFVPDTPHYVRGVINLRGKVIPVVDMRGKFGLEPTEDTNETCVIVVDVQQGDGAVQMGALVDNVSEVLDISEDQIENAPAFGNGHETDYLLGMAKVNEDVKMLLDIDRVLGNEEFAST